ncbi:hypothetical protein BDFG_02258 [Blastomyces dermatitidis ATCC 26199]|nr:hypothetical protein BDFG_02258 [Blastomyces dermatitidis ATCC 26199]
MKFMVPAASLYITVLIKRKSSVTTAVKRAEKELNINELISRRDDTSLQGTVTTAAAVREAEEEEEDVKMRAVLSQLCDITVSVFNQAFLTVTEAAATSQRYLLTRKMSE